MSEKTGSQARKIELPRLSSRERSWKKAKAEAKAKQIHEQKKLAPKPGKLNCHGFQAVNAHGSQNTLEAGSW